MQINYNKGMYQFDTSLYYATFPELCLFPSGSITTPSLVEIIVFSLLIEAESDISCFSSLISK